ncbi:AraC family transcriptional regulator [Rhizobium sp. CCGE 510]|nr:AraC family transcriptional regulator [Rhizobium sp. CCGE 510]
MLESLGEIAPFEGATTDSMDNFNWSANAWSNGTLTLNELTCNRPWHISATSETPMWLTIMVPRRGSCGLIHGQVTTTAMPGQILLGQTHEADRFWVQGADHWSEGLHIDWPVIARSVGELLELPVSRSLEFVPQVDESSPAGVLLHNLVETIISGMRGNGVLLQSPIAITNLTEALGRLIVRTMPHRLSAQLEKKTFTPAPRHVRRAIDYMYENIGRPITISMVAQAANVSVRTLENGFRTFKDATPAGYLRMLRLRAVREELLDPCNQQSIKDVCLKWGFFHAGRFSAMYRSVYAEAPQATQKHSRHKERS